MVLMMPTDFCADLSSRSKDIAIYDKFQNGGQVVQVVLTKLTSTDSEWPKESIDTKIIIFWLIVISKNVHFWYLNTHRWRCSQLWHGPSDHGVDEVYQVWFRLIKVWPRYSIWTDFRSTSLGSQFNNFWTKMNIKNLFSHFCAAQSKDHVSQISEELGQFWRRSSI